MSFGDDLVEIAGRVLRLEPLTWGNRPDLQYNAATADWSRESKGLRLLETKPLDDWLLIFDANSREITENFFRMMKHVGRPIGMEVEQPKMSAECPPKPLFLKHSLVSASNCVVIESETTWTRCAKESPNRRASLSSSFPMTTKRDMTQSRKSVAWRMPVGRTSEIPTRLNN